MLKFIDNLRGKVTSNIQTTADVLPIVPSMVKKLETLNDGEHIYLTLRYLDRHEVVKFTKDGPITRNQIAVERDVLGNGRKNFPCSSCIEADWNSKQLQEFVCQAREHCV